MYVTKIIFFFLMMETSNTTENVDQSEYQQIEVQALGYRQKYAIKNCVELKEEEILQQISQFNINECIGCLNITRLNLWLNFSGVEQFLGDSLKKFDQQLDLDKLCLISHHLTQIVNSNSIEMARKCVDAFMERLTIEELVKIDLFDLISVISGLEHICAMNNNDIDVELLLKYYNIYKNTILQTSYFDKLSNSNLVWLIFTFRKLSGYLERKQQKTEQQQQLLNEFNQMIENLKFDQLNQPFEVVIASKACCQSHYFPIDSMKQALSQIFKYIGHLSINELAYGIWGIVYRNKHIQWNNQSNTLTKEELFTDYCLDKLKQVTLNNLTETNNELLRMLWIFTQLQLFDSNFNLKFFQTIQSIKRQFTFDELTNLHDRYLNQSDCSEQIKLFLQPYIQSNNVAIKIQANIWFDELNGKSSEILLNEEELSQVKQLSNRQMIVLLRSLTSKSTNINCLSALIDEIIYRLNNQINTRYLVFLAKPLLLIQSNESKNALKLILNTIKQSDLSCLDFEQISDLNTIVSIYNHETIDANEKITLSDHFQSILNQSLKQLKQPKSSRLHMEIKQQIHSIIDQTKYQILNEFQVGSFFIDMIICQIDTEPTPDKCQMAIEVDGRFHFVGGDGLAKDRIKDKYLQSCGWNIFRISHLDWNQRTNRQKFDFCKSILPECVIDPNSTFFICMYHPLIDWLVG